MYKIGNKVKIVKGFYKSQSVWEVISREYEIPPLQWVNHKWVDLQLVAHPTIKRTELIMNLRKVNKNEQSSQKNK